MQLTMTEALPIMEKLLSERKLSIFAGSGISVDSNLPAWDGFIDRYIEICEELNASLDPSLLPRSKIKSKSVRSMELTQIFVMMS